MRFVFLSFQILIFNWLGAQSSKPAVDTSVFNKWPSTQNGAISSDGKYVFYIVNNQPIDGNSLIIESLNKLWHFEMTSVCNAGFTKNGRYVVFQHEDSLGLLLLGSSKVEWIAAVRSYQILNNGDNEYLIYLSGKNNGNGALFVENLDSGLRREFYAINKFLIYKDGKTILFVSQTSENNLPTNSLKKVNIYDSKCTTIWSTNDSGAAIMLDNLAIDAITGKMAFLVSHKEKKSIMLYDGVRGTRTILEDGDSAKLKDNSAIVDIQSQGFNYAGDQLFITLKEKKWTIKKSTFVSVDIWNYKDQKLQSQQLYELNHVAPYRNFTAEVNVISGEIITLSKPGEKITLFPGSNDSVAFV